ncbi:C6 transcription factor protein [Rutstroemia sp. NJR-2017a BBW]|nr:C6 transcription factor protein [Rutstroemia sp. NJR-2017a BBW]
MIRKRQPHRKSRMGCFECKRRQVKCDELKPTCTRCRLTLHKCRYLPAVSAVENAKRKPPTLNPLLCSDVPSSLDAPFPVGSPSSDKSIPSVPAIVEAIICPLESASVIALSDEELYHHYLDHTSFTMTHCQSDLHAMQRSIPALALKCQPVLHALLALSAACLCCDMMYKEPPPSLDDVNELLMTGYRHYNLASEQMRYLISQPDSTKTDPLLASTVLLVPFAAASQQINHWISKRTRTPESKPLSTTPRDVIVMMRGIRTTLETLTCDDLAIRKPEFAVNYSLPFSPILKSGDLAAPYYTHEMFAIVASTSQGAFSKLRARLECCQKNAQATDDQLYACMVAFEVLLNIRSITFSPSHSFPPTLIEPEFEQSYQLDSMSMPQIRSWLRFYALRSKNPLPNEPLTRSFLDFLVQVPQAYLDLVLPLLDQRLESPSNATGDTTENKTGITTNQALALDIYAHWSVFMFLVEEESWWIGKLPVVTLTGMVNRYGDRFVFGLCESEGEEHCWWPGSMLTVLREIHRCK